MVQPLSREEVQAMRQNVSVVKELAVKKLKETQNQNRERDGQVQTLLNENDAVRRIAVEASQNADRARDDAGLAQRLKALEDANKARDERLNLILEIATQAKQNFQEVDQNLSRAHTLEERARLLEDRAKAADKYFRDLLSAEAADGEPRSPLRYDSPTRSALFLSSVSPRPQNGDSINSSWKSKADSLTHELQVLQRELRKHLNELRGELDSADADVPQNAVNPNTATEQRVERSQDRVSERAPAPMAMSASAATGPSATPAPAMMPPASSAAERLVLELKGEVCEGVALRVRVVSGPGDLLKYKYRWTRLGPKGPESVDGASTSEYVPQPADVGCELQVTVTPCDAQGRQCAEAGTTRSAAVRGVAPWFRGALISGDRYNTTKLAFSAQYAGGVPGNHTYQWGKSKDGLNFTDIPYARSALYQVTAEDIDACLRVVATPVSATGERGVPVMASTDKIRIDPSCQATVQTYANDGVATFRVRIKTLNGRDYGDVEGVLSFERDRVLVAPDNDRGLSQPYSRETQILLHPEDESQFKLQLRRDSDAVLVAEPPTSRQRDIIALTAFVFANRGGAPPATAEAAVEPEQAVDTYHSRHHLTAEEKRRRLELKRMEFATDEEFLAWKRAEKERRRQADPEAYDERRRRHAQSRGEDAPVDDYQVPPSENEAAGEDAAYNDRYRRHGDDDQYRHSRHSRREDDEGRDEERGERESRHRRHRHSENEEEEQWRYQDANADEGGDVPRERRKHRHRDEQDPDAQPEEREHRRSRRRSHDSADQEAVAEAPEEADRGSRRKHKRRGSSTDAMGEPQDTEQQAEPEQETRRRKHRDPEADEAPMEAEPEPEEGRSRRKHRSKKDREPESAEPPPEEQPLPEGEEEPRRRKSRSRKEEVAEAAPVDLAPPAADTLEPASRKHRKHRHSQKSTDGDDAAAVQPALHEPEMAAPMESGDGERKHKRKHRSKKDGDDGSPAPDAFAEPPPAEPEPEDAEGGKRKHKRRSKKDDDQPAPDMAVPESAAPPLDGAGESRRKKHRSSHKETDQAVPTEPAQEEAAADDQPRRHRRSSRKSDDGAVADAAVEGGGEEGGRRRRRHSHKDTQESQEPPAEEPVESRASRHRSHRSNKDESAPVEAAPPAEDADRPRRRRSSHKDDAAPVASQDAEDGAPSRKHRSTREKDDGASGDDMMMQASSSQPKTKMTKEELKKSMTPEQWRAAKRKRMEEKKAQLSPAEYEEWLRKHRVPKKDRESRE